MAFEASAINIFGPVRPIERHPADRASGPVVSVQHATIHEHSCSNPGADGEKDRVSTAARRSLPGLAEDACGPITFDDDFYLRTRNRSLDFRPQWIIVP